MFQNGAKIGTLYMTKSQKRMFTFVPTEAPQNPLFYRFCTLLLSAKVNGVRLCMLNIRDWSSGTYILPWDISFIEIKV